MVNLDFRLLIHIGYHKTGTTWLQRQIFKKPAYGFDSPWTRERVTADFIKSDGLSPLPDQAISYYRLAAHQSQSRGFVPVISHERLSGYPSSGGYDAKIIADNLYNAFPDAKIFIVIRNQYSMLRSWYMQYILDGGVLSLYNFLHPPQPQLERIPHFRASFYEYDRLIKYYNSRFSSNNVLVLPFEMLVNNSETFVSRLFLFNELTPPLIHHIKIINPSKSQSEILITRIANRMFFYNQLNPNPLISFPALINHLNILHWLARLLSPDALNRYLDRIINNEIGIFINSLYRKSNSETEQLLGIDLSKYGYDV